jgi:hypothetical protein
MSSCSAILKIYGEARGRLMLLLLQIVTTMQALMPPVVRNSSCDRAARSTRQETAYRFKLVDVAEAVGFWTPRTIMSISAALDRTRAAGDGTTKSTRFPLRTMSEPNRASDASVNSKEKFRYPGKNCALHTCNPNGRL